MTTRSSPPRSNRSAVALTEEVHRAGPPGGPAGGGGGGRPDGDPAHGPVRAAAGERPLEEVLRLVDLLEESPRHADAVGPVLRAVALDRPVEDVARLVAELTRPPRPADGADDTIRAAVEHRCVEDVTRLVALLHRAPQRPHCARTAVRAAVGSLGVEELVELIGRLSGEHAVGQPFGADREPFGASGEPFPVGEEPMTGTAGLDGRLGTPEAADPATGVEHRAAPGARLLFWPGWVAAAALVVCGAAHFPLRREGAPLLVYGLALAASGLCGALALALALRAGVAALVAGSVVPAALAGLGYAEGRFAPRELSHTLSITMAPPASAGLTAVCASLASLAALSLLLMVQVAERHPARRPPTEPTD
ncbi:hypothetical protein ACF061_27380 [Streptomyces sp. NPDC015220]|uniref:hypothetical protein n=1 Tax=Streptomyces sp. NPDC015220 TaxID=3364947 RepID=UPI0036FD1C04